MTPLILKLGALRVGYWVGSRAYLDVLEERKSLSPIWIWIFDPWRWRHQVSSKRLQQFTRHMTGDIYPVTVVSCVVLPAIIRQGYWCLGKDPNNVFGKHVNLSLFCASGLLVLPPIAVPTQRLSTSGYQIISDGVFSVLWWWIYPSHSPNAVICGATLNISLASLSSVHNVALDTVGASRVRIFVRMCIASCVAPPGRNVFEFFRLLGN